MKIITTVISFLILALLIFSPIIIIKILRKRNVKHHFITYIFLGFLITSFLALFFAWWSDFSDEILLSSYGYDFNAMDDYERYKNVSPDNLAAVKQLRMSMMGIGWPLKAIMTYTFYSPYLLLIYLFGYLFKKQKKTEQKAGVF